jgi:hypothetical protein
MAAWNVAFLIVGEYDGDADRLRPPTERGTKNLQDTYISVPGKVDQANWKIVWMNALLATQVACSSSRHSV